MTGHCFQYSLGPLQHIPPGEGRNYKLGDRKVAVFRTRDGGVFATQASCPHRAGPLADGLIGGRSLVCPLHDWTFDLATGSSVNGTCGIKTYTARVELDGTIIVEVDDGEEIFASPNAGPMTADISTGIPSPA
jgi:nitrite reductase (NADH) small subunit